MKTQTFFSILTLFVSSTQQQQQGQLNYLYTKELLHFRSYFILFFLSFFLYSVHKLECIGIQKMCVYVFMITIKLYEYI